MEGRAVTVEEIAPDDGRLAWDGLIALVRDGDWWQPWRLPPDRVATAHAPDLALRARMPAAVRIAVRTDAARIAVRVHGDVDSGPLDVLIKGERTHRLGIARGPDRVEANLPDGPKWSIRQLHGRLGGQRSLGNVSLRRHWSSALGSLYLPDGPLRGTAQ